MYFQLFLGIGLFEVYMVEWYLPWAYYSC